MHKILLVDDSRAALLALKGQIDNALYNVVTSQSATASWDVLIGEPFDCILTDLEMPGESGADFCRRIKADDRVAHIPVIILTSLSQTENILMAIDAGADDFVSKDSDVRVIIAKIRAMVRMKRANEELINLRRVEGIKQIVATYNHEFNNPLTIAIGNLNWLRKNCSDAGQMTRIERLSKALERMGELVTKIRELRDYVEKSYVGQERMIDVPYPKNSSAS